MRCYDGCPDSDLQKVIAENRRLIARIRQRGFTVTYFPNGEFYMAFNNKYLSVSGECGCLVELECVTRQVEQG